ncbi:LacI family DNA-binding transcriptional regulator [Streptantibioticus cattleyicolor]|uniref:Transcriptional regulator, LacI family n=1 Tax=Streptantibioticus cattleyicolor (strain ATCC 35852 / DSM 46488 / JCM 4925 / NBRC 14057 / NRRL 8057) TaxID=1003195 RepID=F8JIZ8_STREN|nr:LacI family DNA-binding transcriptional regulator [Streptantibioticus cattleyicolor]AEW98913.1 transcriptional regulator, LacI family [Streptantibioticus cattleyicolor NRRL 8057 = DSM 46488]CCB72040.1 Transcriptional regulator, LacI family [Streptantibioticus cattleyicolor NRRL 8057 = DSM 46488]
MSRPTIGDIAARSGVSKGAVSFALNGRPGVSDSTRARILRVAEQMGWRPHSAARALGGAKAGMVGLVSARPARTLGVEPFYAQLISGLQAGLSGHGVGLQLLIVESIEAEIETYRRWHSEHHVDGVVLFDLRARDPRVAELERSGLPCIVLGGPGKHGSLPNVWADDRAAMLRIVEYLAALGHRRIAHVAGLPDFWHTQRRTRALRDAARRLGLTDATSSPTDFSDAEGATVTRTLLSRRPRPTAIVYDSDIMAVAGLGVAIEMGLSVPGDLSIVAFDDSVLARLMHPSLTALTRDTFALGELLAAAVLEAVAGGPAQRSVQAPTPELVARESTAPPREVAS